MPYYQKRTYGGLAPKKIQFGTRLPSMNRGGKSGRIMYVGDFHQAIYGFSGSNVTSMSTLADELRNTPAGLTQLPLTVTRRCPILVTALARQIVKDFECLEHAKVGTVCLGDHYLSYSPTSDNFYNFTTEAYPEEEVTIHNYTNDEHHPEYGAGISYEKPHACNEGCTSYKVPSSCKDTAPKLGDMVLCRVNAPLVQLAYSLIRSNTPVKIQGRDIGTNLINKIKKLVPANASTELLTERLDGYRTRTSMQLAKQYGAGTPRYDEALARLEDEITCISALCEGLATVQEVFSRIQVLFADVEKGNASSFVLLSSVHKAKGLESPTVRIINPELLPHPMAKLPWQKEQEMNLRYVAITRAIDTLHIH